MRTCIVLTLLMWGGLGWCLGARAQKPAPVIEGTSVTGSFWSNWIMGISADIESAYSDQERHQHLSHNPFHASRLGYGGSIYFGKWFCPSVGVRVLSHFGSAKRTAAWLSGSASTYAACNVQLQTMFNVGNIILGYRPERRWDMSPYIGLGFAHHMAHWRTATGDDALRTSSGNWCMTTTCGIYAQYEIKHPYFVSLDVHARLSSACLDGIETGASDTNLSNRRDCTFGVSVGVGMKLGRSKWRRKPDVQAIEAIFEETKEYIRTQIK